MGAVNGHHGTRPQRQYSPSSLCLVPHGVLQLSAKYSSEAGEERGHVSFVKKAVVEGKKEEEDS